MESKIKPFTQIKLIIYVSFFLVFVDNYTFFKNVLTVYPLDENIGFLISICIVFLSFIVLLFTLFSSKWSTKAILIFVLLVSSLTNYFMNSYHVVIDASMIRNTMQTDLHESLDLVTLKQMMYLLFLGFLPAYLVYRSRVEYRDFKVELFSKSKTIVLMLLIIIANLFIFNKYYTSFFREHKPLRYSTNPTYWIYSIGNYMHKTVNSGPVILKPIGKDAKIHRQTPPHRLVIMVVGEAARADHFSLNGYTRKTNPLLEKEKIINFSNTYACGTSTAVSVPCMFSMYERRSYSYKKGISTENVLDVLSHTKKVSVLWRDNNSDSKGVALRVAYENYKTTTNNTVCTEGECRDEGMLLGLEKIYRGTESERYFDCFCIRWEITDLRIISGIPKRMRNLLLYVKPISWSPVLKQRLPMPMTMLFCIQIIF